MGYEYSINFSAKNVLDVVDLLKTLPHFEQVNTFENHDQYLYRAPENSGSMPNAIARISSEGIYFCDYGDGADILKEMIFRIGLGYRKLEVIDHSD